MGAKGARNHLETNIRLLQDIIVPQPQHLEATALQEPGPCLVLRPLSVSLPCSRARAGVGAKGARNRLQTNFGLLQDIIVPEPQHLEATALQEPGPCLVLCLLVAVLPAVDLDDEPRIEAGEIGDERTNRILPAEFVSVELSFRK